MSQNPEEIMPQFTVFYWGGVFVYEKDALRLEVSSTAHIATAVRAPVYVISALHNTLDDRLIL